MATLEAVNDVLGAIGQSPIQSLDYANPEFSYINNLIDETNRDLQNEGWVWNREQYYPLNPNENNEIPLSPTMLRVDISDGQVWRTTDVVRRQDKLYDKLNHSYFFYQQVYCDIVWLLDYEDLPGAAKRYIVAHSKTRAAMQLITNPELTQLLSRDAQLARATLMEYECNQGDYTWQGTPYGTVHTPYQPYQTLVR